MIPEFPKFKKIELSDREEVEKITSQFPPYSDFNFTSLWIWDISNDMKISQLHKNLVVVFNDYVSDRPFVSFIGKNKIPETTLELINFSEKNYQTPSLELIPEEIANILMKLGFTATPDPASHDYVYSISHLASMNTWPQNSSGKGVRRFVKNNSGYVIKQNSILDISKEEYLEMFERWTKNKNIKDCFILNEYRAFKRLFEIADSNLKVISLYIKNVLVGFTVYEILKNDYAMSHFAKGDISYNSSIYDILNWEEAKILKDQGVKYYNWEQDLGIHGLRISKLKYKPGFLLKQFTITKTSNH